jgi:hypothetical protein
MASYQYVFDDKKQQYSESPLHDWTSDAADALRQMGQAWSESIVNKNKRPQVTRINAGFDPFA